MSRAEKTLAEMEQNPEGWRYGEVASVLKAFGFTTRKRATSHRQWVHPKTLPVTVVDNGKRVPAYQVRQVVRTIRGTLAGEEER